jgi:O6-methylguanine-DNA--protein-cysteine methyltransferase
MSRSWKHHETMSQPNGPKPAVECVARKYRVSQCRKMCCRVKRLAAGVRGCELSNPEELHEEGPNNIARHSAQMTQRFGNAEKNPCSPQTLVPHGAQCALVWKALEQLPMGNVRDTLEPRRQDTPLESKR